MRIRLAGIVLSAGCAATNVDRVVNVSAPPTAAAIELAPAAPPPAVVEPAPVPPPAPAAIFSACPERGDGCFVITEVTDGLVTHIESKIYHPPPSAAPGTKSGDDD